MNKVLIVDDLDVLLKKVEKGLKVFRGEFEVVTASNGEEAIKLLKKTSFSLLVTDVKMPNVDGLELLAFMSRYFPGVPCIVMTAYGMPDILEKLDNLQVLTYIEKPFQIPDLGQAILDALAVGREGKSAPGIPVVDFLTLIEAEEKTCLLEISISNREKGHFYFQRGVLFDSLCGFFQGEKAALKMIAWEDAKIRFKKPAKIMLKQQIFLEAKELLNKAAAKKPDVYAKYKTDLRAAESQTLTTDIKTYKVPGVK